ncbi:TetR/AcrR family transcriptional regulator [Fusibacter paucivorans]|uniref:TetR/AcrR family transcriptional regulator n=1 Tax=Fusibacter paucivorans TaxID=76009 RepID=A0ABS5PM82_9FIRM|nr:TetR/AcrR family transcriptional regulator [Fusibacter paucivorans]MBS7526305.1 TetR/AcrR family transcriptional regulator [Fusibacter paucivorans]
MAAKSFTKREQLIAAALAEFSTTDYESASLNQIIKTSGISKGVFYYHFENKEALYLALLDEANRQKWTFINAQTENNAPIYENLDLFDRFLYQAKMGIAFANEHPQYHLLSVRLTKEKGNPIYERAIHHIGSDGNAALTKLINEAIAHGELRPDFDEAFIHRLITHLFQSFYDIFEAEHTNVLQIQLEHYVDFMRNGLSSHSSGS